MMTRKDFENIAATLNANAAPLELVLDFADMLEETNPRFDRGRFVAAAAQEVHARAKYTVSSFNREVI